MADVAYTQNVAIVDAHRPNWSAIWAGMFSFVAIWSVFGMLGEAIFASGANPNTGNAIGPGIAWGMGIWSIVLTMIAMYVAGRVTAHFLGSATRGNALLAGQTMFGLSVVALAIIVVLGGRALAGGTGVNASSSARMTTVMASLGWAGFISLFLGWLCAMWGATSGSLDRMLASRPTTETASGTKKTENVRGIRAA